MHADWHTYAADALLRDGSSIRIRAIRPDDKERLRVHFRSLGAESVHFRFLSSKKDLTPEDLRYFTEVDFKRHVGLAALRRHDGDEEFIGVGRYVRGEGRPEEPTAEFALAVSDSYQGRGVGTLLLEHLGRIAAASGIERFEAEIQGDNVRMLEVLAGLGFRIAEESRAGVVHAWFPIRPTEDALRASDQRAWTAAAESLRAVLCPRSVALVGASTRPGTIGHALIANLVRGGFRGPAYPVNPGAEVIEGLKCWPSVSAIGRPFDLGIVAVPASAVEGVVGECARAGARGVVVISAGFAEASAEGRARQARLRDLVRGCGMRLLGPNCMGVINTDPLVSLNGTIAPAFPPAGNVGILSESGAWGLAILDCARRLELGISSFVSVGNKADVSGNDLLAYWKDDPRTEVIAIYAESFGNPGRFARLAPEVGRRKPVVAVESGRSAALAGLDVAEAALFEQAGVIRTGTLEDLFDVVSLLSTQPVPRGPRVGVVTNARRPGILLADACEARGLRLPELLPGTVETLRAFLPAAAGLGNPVDMVASATPEHYARTVEAVGADPSVDSLVVIAVPPLVTSQAEIASAVALGAGSVPRHKPVLSVFPSFKGAPAALATGGRGRLPSYSLPENAARALAAAERYGRWRARPRGRVVHLDAASRRAARGVVERALSRRAGPVWLDPVEVEAVLLAAGIEQAPSHLASPDEAEKVPLGREVAEGVDALVAVVTDPAFGPLLVAGLGGARVEPLRDASFRLPPVTDLDAAEMIDRLRPLFERHKGSPPADRPALVALIQRVSALVETLPELREVDLNPVRVLGPGQGAVVVDARIRVGPVTELA